MNERDPARERRKEMMDKDFKKIFDKLVKDKYIEEDTAKVLTVMEAYSDYLDKAVELGAIDEHDARMDFCRKSHEVTAQIAVNSKAEEDDDDDAEDEPCDCDDESSEKSADEAVAEAVKFFVDHQELWEALSGLVKAMRDAGINGTVSFDRDDESWEAYRI